MIVCRHVRTELYIIDFLDVEKGQQNSCPCNVVTLFLLRTFTSAGSKTTTFRKCKYYGLWVLSLRKVMEFGKRDVALGYPGLGREYESMTQFREDSNNNE